MYHVPIFKSIEINELSIVTNNLQIETVKSTGVNSKRQSKERHQIDQLVNKFVPELSVSLENWRSSSSCPKQMRQCPVPLLPSTVTSAIHQEFSIRSQYYCAPWLPIRLPRHSFSVSSETPSPVLSESIMSPPFLSLSLSFVHPLPTNSLRLGQLFRILC